jgi:hypothetical protein
LQRRNTDRRKKLIAAAKQVSSSKVVWVVWLVSVGETEYETKYTCAFESVHASFHTFDTNTFLLALSRSCYENSSSRHFTSSQKYMYTHESGILTTTSTWCMHILYMYSWIAHPTDFRCPALKFEPSTPWL